MTSLRGLVQSSIQRVRSVRPKTWIKIGACLAVFGLCSAEIALRGDVEPVVHRRAHARVVVDSPHVAPHPAAVASVAAPPAKPPASVEKLVAMTHAKTCAERTKAAEALAGVHNKKAVAALKKLAHSKFKDESASPGIFSCSSRRAAQKALEQQGT
jgi:hypothetical protein